jgi:ADP-ribose pyrophosphatase YjhB (NUDIX family)
MNAVERMYGSRTAADVTQVRVGAGVVVRDAQGRVLLERRSDCGYWGLLGGRIEKGESVEQAAVREVKEESGLDVRITRLLGVYSDPDEGRIVAYSATDIIQLVDIVVEAEILGGELTRSAESEELRFFSLDELPSEIVPPARQALEDHASGRAGVLR